MNNANVSIWLCLVFALLSCSGLPSLADTTAGNGAGNGASAGAGQSVDKPAHALLKAPLEAAGFCTGVVVGTPICFVRKLPHELSEGGRGLAGSIVPDTSNKLLVIPAAVVWSPFSCVSAFIHAPASACKHAWEAKKPFSKEQFSLDWIDEASPAAPTK